MQVEASHTSLTFDDSFVLTHDKFVYIFTARKSNSVERLKALKLGNYINNVEHNNINTLVYVGKLIYVYIRMYDTYNRYVIIRNNWSANDINNFIDCSSYSGDINIRNHVSTILKILDYLENQKQNELCFSKSNNPQENQDSITADKNFQSERQVSWIILV